VFQIVSGSRAGHAESAGEVAARVAVGDEALEAPHGADRINQLPTGDLVVADFGDLHRQQRGGGLSRDPLIRCAAAFGAPVDQTRPGLWVAA
jgi:hypothetical protein